jgi:hypothetical protein
MVRPVSGVWASVDSRPVPPARFFGLAFLEVGFLGLGFLGIGFLVVGFLMGRLAFPELRRRALEAAERRFGADALFAARLTAFFFPFFALPAGFLAIRRLRSV